MQKVVEFDLSIHKNLEVVCSADQHLLATARADGITLPMWVFLRKPSAGYFLFVLGLPKLESIT